MFFHVHYLYGSGSVKVHGYRQQNGAARPFGRGPLMLLEATAGVCFENSTEVASGGGESQNSYVELLTLAAVLKRA